MVGDIREHFSNIERNELFAIATLLDPRYKTRGFCKRENVIIVKDLIFAELYKIELSVSCSQESQQVNYSAEQNSRTKRSGWESILDSSSENDDDNVVDAAQEVQAKAYFNEKRIEIDDDPLAYWKERSVQWPQLAKLAYKYLCAPIGSCASEREFKIAKNMSSDERVRLLPENIERLLFAIGYNTEQLKIVNEEEENLISDSIDIVD